MTSFKKSFVNISIFILIFVSFLALGCDSVHSVSGTGETKEKKMLLEVMNEATETIYPPGKTLTLRVFNNAEVEFDYYLPYTPERVGIPFSSEIRKTTITKEQLATIESLLKEIYSENPKTRYTPTQPMLDSHITVTLKYESKTGLKQIVMEENDSRLHLEKTNAYSPALTKLMSLVYEIYFDNRKRLIQQDKSE
jgi:hypothetical protein